MFAETPAGTSEAEKLTSDDFPELYPQELLEILDAGRAYAGGLPMWSQGDRPCLEQRVIEGDPGLSL